MSKKYQQFMKELEYKKVAIIGAGVSNQPLIPILKKNHCDITLFDQKTLEEVNNNVKKIILDNQIKTSLGEDYLENLIDFDYIFRSPSILPTNPYLKKAEENGTIITTEVEEVIKLTDAKVIAVTGSKGKTTTTTIIASILSSLGYNVFLGGNIGTPLFSEINNIKEDDIVVLELSSFQLMNMKTSPNIAAVTNISPDHLDIHKSYQEYIDAKKNIYKNQNTCDTLVLNEDDEIVSSFSNDANSNIIYFGHNNHNNNYYLKKDGIYLNEELIIPTKNLTLKGEHNYLNICAGLNAIKDYINVDNNKLLEIIKNIKGVQHRLEYVRTINGVDWYNDSASTTPDKSLAGLNAFSEKIVLIAGGYDKNISYEEMALPIIEHVSKLILFGNTKNKIYDAVMNYKKANGGDIQIYLMDTLEEVVNVAYKVSTPGEVVLFSPASASFDMFKNAYERGDLFKKLTNSLDDVKQ